MSGRLFSFVGGDNGFWSVVRSECVKGQPLEAVARVEVCAGTVTPRGEGDRWVLRGITSHERYVTRPEKAALVATQEGLGRGESTSAAMIPIRKSAAWWALTQDERRAIFEEQSRHIEIGLKHLPPVARRLHHSRDLGEHEPFDFITWFEYAPSYESGFNDLLAALRSTPEWRYVEREIDIRLARRESDSQR
jgi:hypothetical protein